jgi:hypothetical protein
LDEIDRLLVVSDAFDHCNRAEEALFGGEPGAALREVDLALGRLPGDENARFMRAGALIVSGQPDAGVRELRSLISARPTWGVVVRSVAAQGLFPVPEGVDLDDIIS